MLFVFLNKGLNFSEIAFVVVDLIMSISLSFVSLSLVAIFFLLCWLHWRTKLYEESENFKKYEFSVSWFWLNAYDYWGRNNSNYSKHIW